MNRFFEKRRKGKKAVSLFYCFTASLLYCSIVDEICINNHQYAHFNQVAPHV